MLCISNSCGLKLYFSWFLIALNINIPTSFTSADRYVMMTVKYETLMTLIDVIVLTVNGKKISCIFLLFRQMLLLI